MNAADLRAAYRDGSLDPVAVVSAAIARCEDDPDNAMIAVARDQALAAARQSAERHAAGRARGPWDGIPFAAKDNIAAEGIGWTAGIGGYRDRIADTDAETIAMLKSAGAILVGKCNLHEAALGTSNDNPWFGRCHNPHRHGYTPGGSSGGSGAAVARGLVPLALGTDTMGSVRVPAACCGVFGYKPSRGRVSLHGVTPLSEALDTIGLIATSIDDLVTYGALLADVAVPAAPRAPSIGVLPGPVLEQADAVVIARYREALERIAGGEMKPKIVDWPADNSANRRAGLVLCEVEAYAAHRAALERDPQGFSEDLRKMLFYGRDLSADRLAEAQATVAALTRHFDAMMRDVDAVLTPATPSPAHSFDVPAPASFADFTAPANLTGRPATALPFGATADRIPLGLQLVGHRDGDGALLALTRAVHTLLDTDN